MKNLSTEYNIVPLSCSIQFRFCSHPVVLIIFLNISGFSAPIKQAKGNNGKEPKPWEKLCPVDWPLSHLIYSICWFTVYAVYLLYNIAKYPQNM